MFGFFKKKREPEPLSAQARFLLESFDLDGWQTFGISSKATVFRQFGDVWVRIWSTTFFAGDEYFSAIISPEMDGKFSSKIPLSDSDCEALKGPFKGLQNRVLRRNQDEEAKRALDLLLRPTTDDTGGE